MLSITSLNCYFIRDESRAGVVGELDEEELIVLMSHLLLVDTLGSHKCQGQSLPKDRPTPPLSPSAELTIANIALLS